MHKNFQHIYKGVFLQLGVLLIPLLIYSQNPYFKNYTTDDGLAGNIVYHVMQDSKGYIWFATETGVSRFDGNRFVNYTVENGLSANEVLKLFEDSKGRIWFLTYSGKPSYFLDGKLFNMHNDSLVKKLCSRSYFDILLEDKAGNLWLINSGGVIKVDKNNVLSRVSGLPNGIRGFWEDSMGNIRAITGNSYINLSDKSIRKSNYTITGSAPIVRLDDGGILIFSEQGILKYKDNIETLIIRTTNELVERNITDMVMDNNKK